MPNPKTIKTAPNVLQVAIHGTWANVTQVTNVMYYQFPSAPDEANCLDVAEQAIAVFQDLLLDVIHADYTVDIASWMLMTSATSPTGDALRDESKPIVGSKITAALPSNCAMLIHKTLEASSRSARSGRWYIIGVQEADVDGFGSWIEAQLTAIQTQVDLYFATARTLASSLGGVDMVQPHWSSTNRPPVEAGGLWPSTSVANIGGLRVDPIIGTQRRRMRR